MNLERTLDHLYPVRYDGWMVIDRGAGPVAENFDTVNLGPYPDQATLDAAWLEVLAEDTEALREDKYNLNASLANDEIEAAEHTPQQGVTLDDRGATKENLHRNNRAKRNASMTAQDDAMADYVDSVYDVLDLADDEVELLDQAGLEAWDGSTIVWPVWTPPI